MTRAILASATPDREDRLFPGDIKQFTTGGLNVAYGAAGVLYALAVTGAGRYPEHEEWLVKRAADPGSGTRLGFYDGLHGVAYGYLGPTHQPLFVQDPARGVENLKPLVGQGDFDDRVGLLEEMEQAFYHDYKVIVAAGSAAGILSVVWPSAYFVS